MQLSDTHNQTRSLEDTQRERPHGLMTADGPTNTSQPRAGKVVHVLTKKQAQWIKSKMRQTERPQLSKRVWMQIITNPGTKSTTIGPEDILAMFPEGSYKNQMEIAKLYPGHGPIMYGKRDDGTATLPTTKTQDQLTVEAFSKPASGDCILAHLTRMSAILHLKGSTEEDGLKSAFLLTDYTSRLLDMKVLEVDLFLACEHFIETNEDGFFPTIAKLLKYVGKVG